MNITIKCHPKKNIYLIHTKVKKLNYLNINKRSEDSNYRSETQKLYLEKYVHLSP